MYLDLRVVLYAVNQDEDHRHPRYLKSGNLKSKKKYNDYARKMVERRKLCQAMIRFKWRFMTVRLRSKSKINRCKLFLKNKTSPRKLIRHRLW